MPETHNAKKHTSAQRELEGKNVAHYTVLLDHWIQTRMEHDRTIIALSSGAIGLLVTILTTTQPHKIWIMLLYCGAFVSFSLCIWLPLTTHKLNTRYIESCLRQKTPKSTTLEQFDKSSSFFFFVGVAFFAQLA